MSHLYKPSSNSKMLERLTRIKNGDKAEREQFIQDYIPFIIKTVSNRMNQYIETENSLEYMIGLEAFNEAIDKYEFSKGNFINFSSLVIRNRIIDHMRKKSKDYCVVSIDCIEQKNTYITDDSLESGDFTYKIEQKEEIEIFKRKLLEFDITLNDLVKEAPKHKSTRENALKIAIYISEQDSLKVYLLKKRRLPNKELREVLDISKKMLSRHRKFIIATVLILDSHLDFIKDYVFELKGGVANGL